MNGLTITGPERQPGMVYYSRPGIYDPGSECHAIYILLSTEPDDDGWRVAIFQMSSEPPYKLFGAQVEEACDERLDMLKYVGRLEWEVSA